MNFLMEFLGFMWALGGLLFWPIVFCLVLWLIFSSCNYERKKQDEMLAKQDEMLALLRKKRG